MNELGHSLGGVPQEPSGAEPGARATLVEIGDEAEGQRIDNFLLGLARGVPKSHIYRILRSGEVRVNKGRIDAAYRLQRGDVVRVPPMRLAQRETPAAEAPPGEFPVLFEDGHLLVIDKPAGVAVHGGSGVAFGVIEQLRRARPQAKFLELVHRLDRETSGILILAKRRSALVDLHEQLRAGTMDKRYLACVVGRWPQARTHLRQALHKYHTPDGERRVRVQADGQAAHTIIDRLREFDAYTLVQATLRTGRTHQIRVHLAHGGHPIIGDEKYGDFALNKALARPGARPGLKRMFLHAWRLRLRHPDTGATLELEAPLPSACAAFLDQLAPPQAPHGDA